MFFPDDYKCIFCGKDIPNFYDKPYCEECEKILPFNNGERCKVCDVPCEDELCKFCLKEKKNFVRAFCPLLYEGVAKNTVLSYKDENKRYLAKGFAIMISKRILESGIDIDFITYIPMTQEKEKVRTFNQAKLLAEELGKILNKPVLSYFKKIKDVEAQKSLNYQERHNALVGAYDLKEVKTKNTDKVLIVDDIITTTATVNYCAGLLYSKVDAVYVCGLCRTRVKGDKGTEINREKLKIHQKLFKKLNKK